MMMLLLARSVMPKCATARWASAARSVYVFVGPGGLLDDVPASVLASFVSSTQIPASWSVGFVMWSWAPDESVW